MHVRVIVSDVLVEDVYNVRSLTFTKHSGGWISMMLDDYTVRSYEHWISFEVVKL